MKYKYDTQHHNNLRGDRLKNKIQKIVRNFTSIVVRYQRGLRNIMTKTCTKGQNIYVFKIDLDNTPHNKGR